MTEQERLVDLFVLEVGEGRMPSAESEERVAYEEYRAEEIISAAWSTEEQAEFRAWRSGRRSI